jgi:hypothetical protein
MKRTAAFSVPEPVQISRPESCDFFTSGAIHCRWKRASARYGMDFAVRPSSPISTPDELGGSVG